MNNEILNKIKGGLVVSCQALPHEPLHGSEFMAKMAYAALLGGAVGIRANTVSDITAIKKVVDLPIIGIIKRDYDDSSVYITPTLKEIDELCEIGVDIIALDATNRMRPGNLTLEVLFAQAKEKYPNQLFMADTSCFEEGLAAEKMGFDIVATTMAGYTPYTKGRPLPDTELLERYVNELHVPIIAEGGVHYPEQLRKVLDIGAHCAVVGGAITRPLEITQRFVAVL